ncbi:hypothetical protein A988_13374 [Pseudomonas syringae BRIP39023]|nr:hypothetical protein A988_13374 [Pseudomonas syringae BRIP39023]PBP30277.1 hypothetical protein CCL12_25625 [Pseudomonas syringae]PBP89143.1 hypothetical protein CCL20_07505 [Pseudomonas syringae]
MIICLIRQLKHWPAIRTHLPAGWSARKQIHDRQDVFAGAGSNALLYIEGCVSLSQLFFYI